MNIWYIFNVCIFFSAHAMYNPDWTMLHRACYEGQLAEVERCFDHDPDVNQQNRYGLTPLMMAVQMHNQATPARSYYEIVTALISRGADATLKTNDGRTALDICNQNSWGNPLRMQVASDIKKLLEYHMTNAF